MSFHKSATFPKCLFTIFFLLALLKVPVNSQELNADAVSLKGWKSTSWGDDVELSGTSDQTLEWRFSYGKKPSVMKKKSDDFWKMFRKISFQAKSDRDGVLFLRLDQKDKKIFLSHFNVSTSWKQITLAVDDFSPFGKDSGASLDPSLISNIYMVDLNGSDEGARGDRTVFLTNFVFNPGSSLKSRASSSMKKAGLASFTATDLPLVAYGSKGNILSQKDFTELGTSGTRWCFLKNLAGDGSLEMSISTKDIIIDNNKVDVPVLEWDQSRPASLEILFWQVGKRYKIWLQADGNGKGIQYALKKGTFLLNRELTVTRFNKLKSYLKVNSIKTFDKELINLEEEIADLDNLTTLRQQAAMSDKILERLLEISEKAVRDHSRFIVTKKLTPGPLVKLPSPATVNLKPGNEIIIKLEEPAFRIGVAQSFGFVFHNEPATNIERYFTELRQSGFNTYVMPLFWDQVVDSRNRFTDWEQKMHLPELIKHDYTFIAHGLIQNGMPDHVRKLKDQAFTTEAKEHLVRMADHLSKKYGRSIILWEAINEPTSNTLGGMKVQKRVDMISELIGQSRSSLPDVKIMINDYDWQRGLEAEKSWSNKNIAGTYEFYKKLLLSRNIPDVLGIEWYPGARVDRPEFRVDMSEPCMDLLDTSLYWDKLIALGLPLILTESNFPGSMTSKDNNGYAWGRWSEASQAEAAVDTFYLALSKPQIIGWNWWSITDTEPWNRDGGLYTTSGKPKKTLIQLRSAIANLKEEISTKIENKQRVSFPELPGKYRITLKGNNASWMVQRLESGHIIMVPQAGQLGILAPENLRIPGN